MTSRGIRSSQTLRLVALGLAATSLVQCAQDTPSGPQVLDVRAAAQPLAAKSGQGPSVSSANPSYGDQGTTIDVQILGSGFTSGATATWLLNGVADNHVHTNSTRFVSSSEVDASITIAPDASLAFWDVQVSLIGGKNGVGSDAFEVTSAQVLAPIDIGNVQGTNDLLEVVGSAGDAFVVDDAGRFVDLGAGQAFALEPNGNTVLGRDSNFPNEYARAWTRQADGSWTATTLPPAPNRVASNALSAAYAPDGSLLVGGWDGGPGPHPKTTIAANRPVVWQRIGTTWNPPILYALPSGATVGSARTVNRLGQIAGGIDASGTGAVWDSPTTPIRLDGLPNAINSTGTLIVGERTSGSTTVPVYWWRDPLTLAWHTTGVQLPSIGSATCSSGGHARGLNEAGVVVGDSCNADARTQASVWMLDLSGGSPVLVGSVQALPGLGAHAASGVPVSSAAGVTTAAPYAVAGAAAQSGGKTFPVRWVLR